MKIQRKTCRADVPVMAMGDIAFNLLIFFFILARVQDDSHLKWQPARGKKIEAAGHARVSVLIDHESKLYLNGAEVGLSGLSQAISDELDKIQDEERIVLLKVHKEVVANRFQPVLEAISEAGGELVHVLEKQRE